MKKLKDKIKNASAGDVIYFSCFLVSIGLLIYSAITPPPGEIHPSILRGVAIMGVFSTVSKIGDWIKLGVDVKLKKGEFELEVDSNEQKDESK